MNDDDCELPHEESKPMQTGLTRRRLLKTAAVATVLLTLPHAEAALPKPIADNIDSELPPLPVDKVALVVRAAAVPFDLGDVRLLPGLFQDAQKRDGAYILFLEPDRLLHNFRVNAGLTPKAPIYGGWESAGVAGHILGHYLTATSMMFRATGDRRFRQRVDYIVGELAVCQAADGLVTAIPDARTIFAKIAADGTVTGWVPWYTTHKVLAGLRDSYRYCGNAQGKEVFLKLTDWALATTANLTDDQFQNMLQTEHGGMVETISDAYAMTGDTKYKAFAHRFTHHAVFDPLALEEDKLDGLHSNTQIPKMIGYERLYELTGEMPYHTAPNFFWQTVTQTRSYANGGNGNYEHFFPISQFGHNIQSDTATETCCTYNMLKLTKTQFQQDPDVQFADYYERAVLNHILASQETRQGLMIYHTPMKPGHFKIYDDPVNAFWCCTGTGIENHARYGEAIYFHSPENDALYVNLYIPSTLSWKEKGLTVKQETSYPEAETTRLIITSVKPTPLSLKLRYPSWTSGLTVKVSGKAQHIAAAPGSYVTINRTWRSGDVVDVRLPMALRVEALPNTQDKQAIFYGPVLLAGALGTSGMDKLPDIDTNQAPYDNLPALPVSSLVAPAGQFLSQIKPVAGSVPLTFQTAGLGKPDDITLIPIYRLNHQRLNIYWSVYTPEDYKARVTDVEEKQRALDARTSDRFLPGGQQSEVDHNLQSQGSTTGIYNGQPWRDARDGGQFSFTLKLTGEGPYTLDCTYWGSETGARVFDIAVDQTTIATQALNNNQPDEFFDVEYKIPVELTLGKASITVTFHAKPGQMAGGLFGCRLLHV